MSITCIFYNFSTSNVTVEIMGKSIVLTPNMGRLILYGESGSFFMTLRVFKSENNRNPNVVLWNELDESGFSESSGPNDPYSFDYQIIYSSEVWWAFYDKPAEVPLFGSSGEILHGKQGDVLYGKFSPRYFWGEYSGTHDSHYYRLDRIDVYRVNPWERLIVQDTGLGESADYMANGQVMSVPVYMTWSANLGYFGPPTAITNGPYEYY